MKNNNNNKKKNIGSDLNQAFDSKRDDDLGYEDYNDFPGFEFNSFTSSGEFSSNEFG